MSNSYFQFKQFKVDQDGVGMKVSTDACIQGAWTPIAHTVKSILDIGTGTGLLSLMLAQGAANVKIDAIEVDKIAAQRAHENVAKSNWSERINVISNNALTHYYDKSYDMIICNPPFFQNDLKSDVANRNIARHNDLLPLKELVILMGSVLKADGYASVLLPIREQELFEQELEDHGWSIYHKLMIQPRKDKPVNRVVSLCSRNAVTIREETLCIYKEIGEYSEEFKKLLAPYYLNL